MNSQQTRPNRLVPVVGDNEFTVRGCGLGFEDWEEFLMSINALKRKS